MKNDKTPLRPSNYVSLIQNNKIQLENVSDDLISAVKDLGAREDRLDSKLVWILPFTNKTELTELLSRLNKLDFLFVGQPYGWPPAEIFANLVEKNILKEKFREITWVEQNKWVIRER
jgi:hypothetical protein